MNNPDEGATKIPESETRLAECMGRWKHHWVWVWVNGELRHCECSTCGQPKQEQS